MQSAIQRIVALAAVGCIGAFAPPPLRASRHHTELSASALIVQNKGGGHGELGYQLAKALQNIDRIDSITMLQDDACKVSAEPFKSYATDLPNVKVVKAPLGDENMDKAALMNALENVSFDYVFDNNSKGPKGAGKAVCEAAKDWNVKLYVFVSSAGMYEPGASDSFPMPENTQVKTTSGQYQQEQFAAELGLPLVTFRPQYIYGPKSNKHSYLDWYFDRLVRELPLPIPNDGTQLASITNSQDVASLLCAPLNNEAAAIEQRVFNCGTDVLHSYNEVAMMCASAAGIPQEKVMLEHYDASLLGKGDFPFRPTNFYVAPDTAKEKLGWPGATHKLADDLPAYFADYQARGGPDKKMDLGKDWEIVVGSKTSPPEYAESLYSKYDPVNVDFSRVEN